MAEQDKTIQEQNRENLGVLGIGAGIATGIAAKTPIGRAGKKIYSGIKGLMKSGDEISDLPTAKLNEVSNARIIPEEETLTALQKRQKVAREEMEYNNTVVDDIKKRVAENPLTLAGRNTAPDTDISVHGSALFDAIATFPNMGRKKGYQAPAQAWADYFKKGQVGKLGDIKLNVTRDELADTNIAYFDDKNNLTGGYLKLAQDEKVPVSAKTLLEMVAKSPAHNTRHIRMGYSQDFKPAADDFFDEFDDVMAGVKKQVDDLANKNDIAMQRDPNVSINADAKRLQEDLDDLVEYYYTKGTDFKARNFGASSTPGKELDGEFLNSMRGAIRGLSNKKERFDDLGIPFDSTLGPLMNKFDNFAGVLQKEIGMGHTVRHSQDAPYRLFGPEEYYEDLVYFRNPKGGITGDSLFGPGFQKPRNKHYDGLADNQLYHVRYGKRSLQGNSNEKVYTLDELQADVQQSAREMLKSKQRITDRNGDKLRINPTNSDYLQSLFKDRRVEKYYEMEDLITKQTKLTGRFDTTTSKEYSKLSKEFDEISAAQADPKTGNMSVEDLKTQYGKSYIDFQPMLDTERGYGAHGLKFLIKQAARNNIDYIAINPAEMVSLKKRGDRAYGNLLNYGNARGTAGYKNYEIGGTKTNSNQTAIYPKILKDLAKQYKSETKTIMVAKSDPKKPFKVIEDGGFNAGEETFTYANTEHLAAFKTRIEAERYGTRRSGRIVEMDADDPELYYPVFGLKITPEMKSKPFKLYKKTGGLVVDIFKW